MRAASWRRYSNFYTSATQPRNAVPTPSKKYHDHDEIALVLPWYVNNSLSDIERSMVEEHLSSCVTCRAELSHLHAVRDAVAHTTVPMIDSGVALQALNQRLTRSPSPTSAVIRAIVTRCSQYGYRLTNSHVSLAALCLALALGLTATLILNERFSPAPPNRYQTLGADTAYANGAQDLLRIVFADDLNQAEIAQLLDQFGLRLLPNTTASLIHTVAIESRPGRDRSVSTVLNVLRASGAVRYVEYVDTGEGNDSAE